MAYMYCHRIFKQTVRSAGANLTVKHIKEVSLSVLFLMEAAKKADEAFDVPPKSYTHTVANADKDILKMIEHLNEKEVTTQASERTTPSFTDPIEVGMSKFSSKWLKKTLDRTSVDSTDLEEELVEYNFDISDADYNLADIQQLHTCTLTLLDLLYHWALNIHAQYLLHASHKCVRSK